MFVGGGTPSILSVRRMEEIFEALRESFFLAEDAEITIECNPGTLEKEKLEDYKCLGVNRLSLGLQSAKNEELRLLGRIHTWETFLESFQMARKAGFECRSDFRASRTDRGKLERNPGKGHCPFA